jgi:hypothetical protein
VTTAEKYAYGAFRYYFRRGSEDSAYPIDWHRASLD